MSTNLSGFAQMGDLLNELAQKLEKVDRNNNANARSLFIETQAITTPRGMLARVWGPFRSEEEADNYINVKRDRYRLQSAALYREPNEEGVYEHTPTDDKELLMYPLLRYRIITGDEFFSKYVATMLMGLVRQLVTLAENPSPEWLTPTEDYGILDEDEESEEDTNE